VTPKEWTVIVGEVYVDLTKATKSEWIDELLPRPCLRSVRLIEVPALEPIPNKFRDVIEYVEEA